MCDPMFVGIGAQGVGTLLQASALKQRGEAAKSVSDRNAFYAQQAAGDAIYRGTVKDLQETLRGSAVIAAQRVEESGSGVDMNVGGPAATGRASQAVIEVSRDIVRRNAALDAYGLRAHAQDQYQRGEYEEAEGNNAALGTFLGGLGKVATEGMKLGSDVTAGGSEASSGDGSFGGLISGYADEAD